MAAGVSIGKQVVASESSMGESLPMACALTASGCVGFGGIRRVRHREPGNFDFARYSKPNPLIPGRDRVPQYRSSQAMDATISESLSPTDAAALKHTLVATLNFDHISELFPDCVHTPVRQSKRVENLRFPSCSTPGVSSYSWMPR
jgi:hypothetical protein